MNIIWLYSAKKNKTKHIDEYSTLNPATSSDSPSVKSKGALLVSAKQDTKNIKAAGNKGNKNQIVCFWDSIITERFKVPEHIIAVITINPIETS